MSFVAQRPRLVASLPVAAELGAFHLKPSRLYADVATASLDPAQLGQAQAACRSVGSAGGFAGICGLAAIKALFFDMDATVIVEESLVTLAAHAGCGPQVHAITERAMAGEMDFKTALLSRVALLRGLPEGVIAKVVASLTLMPGIKALVHHASTLQVPSFLISGGFVQMAGPVARAVGFADFHANRLEITDGVLTGALTGELVDGDGKRRFLEATCHRLGLPLTQVVAIGDGANDLPMLRVAGLACGHKPKPVLLPELDVVNGVGDHQLLIPLLFGDTTSP